MRMRKGVIAAAVIGLVGALSAVGISSAASTVSIEPSTVISPNKLPKKNFKAASLNAVVETTTDAPGEFPTATTNVRLDFDDDIKITTKGLKKCTADLDNTTTAQARDACRRSLIGTGVANAIIPPNVQTAAIVSAFNGPTQGGKPTIILHARTDVGITQVLSGRISRINSGDFGTRLNVPVPPLPAGAVLYRFEVTVEKSWKSQGKKYNYITARCKDGNKTLNMKGNFELAAEPTPQSSSDSKKCKVT